METAEETGIQEKEDMVNGQRELTSSHSEDKRDDMQKVEESSDKVKNHVGINKSTKNCLSESEEVISKLSERHGEKISCIKTVDAKTTEENDQAKSVPEKIVPNEIMRHIVTIPIQKIEEGDDLDIYDDPGESGEDLDDVEQQNKTCRALTDEKLKIPPPILRNSAILNTSDALERENTEFSENTVNFREDLPINEENVNRVTWSAINNHYDEARHLSGIRGKANTPASLYTDFSIDSR